MLWLRVICPRVKVNDIRGTIASAPTQIAMAINTLVSKDDKPTGMRVACMEALAEGLTVTELADKSAKDEVKQLLKRQKLVHWLIQHWTTRHNW